MLFREIISDEKPSFDSEIRLVHKSPLLVRFDAKIDERHYFKFFLFDLEKHKSETLRNFVANITGVNTHEADN